MEKRRFEVFYDGDCPLCVREIRMLRRMDRKRGRILFTDIAAPGFDAMGHAGVSQDDLMAEIYGRTESGELVSGMEVFRQLYSAVGLGFLFAPTGWPGLRIFFDAAYRLFAKNRLRLTGRCKEEGVCNVLEEAPAGR